MNGENKKLMSF